MASGEIYLGLDIKVRIYRRVRLESSEPRTRPHTQRSLPAWVEQTLTSTTIDGIYTHLDATSSILPHLKAYLPHASTELYVVEVPPAPNSTVLTTYPPTESPPKSSPWAVGVLGITDMPETEFWFWSSVEVAPTINRDEDEERFRTAHVQFEQMLRFICRIHPEKETLLVGSLHSGIASYIHISSRDYWSEWIKLAFSKHFLPPPSPCTQDIESKYIFKKNVNGGVG